MVSRIRTIAQFTLAMLCLALVFSIGRADENKSEKKEFDEVLYKTLREVINRGADLYNSGDMSGCYRFYEGSLRSIRPLLAHKPELQKAITKSISSADADPVVWRRAFTLRSALDKVRENLKPKKGEEKLPQPKKDDKKGEEKKEKAEEKEEEKKSDDKDKGEKKEEKLEKKGAEKKDP